MKIKVETEVQAPISAVWQAWVNPQDITQWNYANDEWCCPSAEVDLQIGGRFNHRMEAKDGSMGFDFEGEFTHIETNRCLQFKLDDARVINVDFSETGNGVKIVETFDADEVYPVEMQQQGWQTILDHFKQHVEQKCHSTSSVC